MGQNIGCYTSDASTPGDLAMIMTPEQAALKAQQQFDSLRDFVERAARDGQRIDTVERELFRQLLGLGHTLLSAFVAAQGDGDLGPQAEAPSTVPLPMDRPSASRRR